MPLAAMKTILITPGDPGGLGPELVARLSAAPLAGPGERLVVLGSAKAVELHCRRQGLPVPGLILESLDNLEDLPEGVYLHAPEAVRGVEPEVGRATVPGGLAAGKSLEAALDLLVSGRAEALATGPLNKAMLKAAGFDFPGHTEFLAKGAGLGPDEVVMHLCGDRLRVSLATTHPPLAEVPRRVTPAKLDLCLRLTCGFVRRLGLPGPVAVCGLNPHAGEQGTIGREEIDVVIPAVERARAAGLDAAGPFPADTVFYRAYRGEFAAVLAMYHDQGLGPLKLVHFNRAVNVTLGLPFVRTSVDHGTGYDIAGTGKASTQSMRAALDLARRLTPDKD